MEEIKKSNTESRKKLIETAKKLFYQNGYAATTLSQISTDAKINNGLITYYFGSKANLAGEISTEYIFKIRNEIARQLYLSEKSYNLAVGVAVEAYVNLSLKLRNPNLLRFEIESAREQGLFVSPTEKRQHYYHLQKRLISPNLSELDLKFYEVCGISVVGALSEAYANGFLDCEVEDISDYLVHMLFFMLQIPQDQFEILAQKARGLSEQIHIEMKENFEIQPY
jgi:AcrR family transcriptional regulator